MFYDNYVKLCNEIKKAPSAVAEEIGLSRASVYGWKKGKSPTDATLRKIADYFQVPMAYLSGEVDDTHDRTKTHWMELFPLPPNAIPYVRGRRIPVLGSIPAGVPVLATENIEGYDYADVPEGEDYFFLRVKGDSMINAGINSGDLVLIKQQSCADNGNIVACIVNGDEATLKRFYQNGDTAVLQPENAAHMPIIVPCKEFDTGYAKIIGVAKKVVRDL